MPRTLEKKLGNLPHCATVVSPKGGANAADFVLSLHAGMLHATLPHHIPFLMITNDTTLQGMAAELQRLGRVASIWTSHREAEKAPAPKVARPRPARPNPRRIVATKKPTDKSLAEVAADYAARLQRIKDAPSRLKTLLNDIKNRSGSHGVNPEEVLEQLKLHHGVTVDAQGRVQILKIKTTNVPPTDKPEAPPL